MIENAKVVALNGNMAKVQVKRVSACGDSCASCKGGCTPSYTYVDVVNDVEAVVGQKVEIEMQTSVVLSAVVLNYVLPLLMLIIGIFSGGYVAEKLPLNLSKDLVRIILGFTLMALSYLFTSQIDKIYEKAGKVRFNVRRIL